VTILYLRHQCVPLKTDRSVLILAKNFYLLIIVLIGMVSDVSLSDHPFL